MRDEIIYIVAEISFQHPLGQKRLDEILADALCVRTAKGDDTSVPLVHSVGKTKLVDGKYTFVAYVEVFSPPLAGPLLGYSLVHPEFARVPPTALAVEIADTYPQAEKALWESKMT